MYSQNDINDIVRKAICAIEFKQEPATLYEPLEYMMAIGGKRLRPRLCLTTYNLFKDNIDNNIIMPSLALELFHSFTLMHDDIMDNAELRRGKPSIHAKWGENSAILCGDALSILSLKFLEGYKGPEFRRLVELFTDMSVLVMEGQQYDMDFEDMPVVTMDDYIRMIGLKTAALIACSAKMGAIIGGAGEQVWDALYKFGWELGLAFQITDDYLDTFGDPQIFGKKVGGDIENNKKTWLLVECQKLASGDDRLRLEALLAQTDDMPGKVAAMQELYKKHNVDSRAIEAISHYYDSALAALDGLGLDADRLASLTEFARGLVYRKF